MDIKHVMNTDYKCCLATATLKDVLLMLKSSIHAVVIVVDNNRIPIGVISEQDVNAMHSVSGYNDSEFLASDVIKNKEIYTCWEGDDAQIAISMIKDRKVCLLPVVNNEFCLVGIMSECNVAPFTGYEVLPFTGYEVYK